MEKLKMHSLDKLNDNILKIGALFPNCLTERINSNGEVERAIDFDVLRQELSREFVEGNEERYQFTWPDKKNAMRLANAPINKTLRPCREESVDFDTTQNLYIEGDNLEVLKLLQETYLGKIKMIYIDPPYNTGNDFVYEDDFSQSAEEYFANSGQQDEDGNRLFQNTESNGRFHTDWLNMMYPRLKLAKDLLSDDGVIFISIDNNEFATLKMLCDNIFSEASFVTVLHVQMSTVQGQKVRAAKAGNIVKNAEYILVYSKNGNKAIGVRPLLDPVKYDNHYNKFLKVEGEGVFTEVNLVDELALREDIVEELKVLKLIPENGCKISSSALQEYYQYSLATKDFINSNADYIIRVHDSIDVSDEFKNKMTVGKIYYYEADKRSYYVCKGSNGVVTQRISLGEKLTKADDFYGTFGPTTLRGDWWSGFYLDMGNVSKEGDVNYDNGKKPVRLLKQLIEFSTNENDIVMDFFAGSATTAHAVMELSANDGKRRNFIMVQLDEDLDVRLKNTTGENKTVLNQTLKFLDAENKPHILSEIGKERIRRAGKKIKDENPLSIQDLDVGFRVLKCDSSNMKEVYYTPGDYSSDLFEALADNIKEDRTPEDLLFQVMLDLGVLLSSKIEAVEIGGKHIYNVEDGYLMACFDNDLTDEVITEVAKLQPYYFVMRDSSMASDSVAANFEQIFNTYSPNTVRRVL